MLGPVVAAVGAEEVELGPARQRALLAALLVDGGRPVPPTVLIGRVWGEAQPARVRHALHVYLSQLRRSLPVEIRREAGGYRLVIEPEAVDLHQFDALTRAGGCQAQRRRESLGQALALWRGQPLTGVGGDWADSVRVLWHRKRVEAAVAWSRAHREPAEARSLVGPLSSLVAEYPLVEPLAAEYMRALHQTGRSAEALQHFSVVRARLAAELGADPGAELCALNRDILRLRPADDPAPGLPPAPAPPPRQLPVDVRGFVGRAGALARLDRLADGVTAGGTDGGTAVIVTVSGTAGVGKTALAVHWAHRVAHRFPDGQLYVDLRGFDPGGVPMTPAEAIRGFLEALGSPPERQPAEPAARSGLYRTLLADKRMLVVLDNARAADQIRPLLPAGPGCLVLITSRHGLTGLLAAEAAHAVPLGMLDTGEARDLLTARLGAERTAAQAGAVDTIIGRCARLPLALAIAAARAAARPDLPLAALAGELRDGERLDALSTGDVGADVRSVFRWSYEALSPPAARLFGRLGLHPAPAFSESAAASLAGVPVPQVRPLLAELVRAQLAAEPTPGRYAMHDLLHEYSSRLAPDAGSAEATARMREHYLHSARAADRLLEPARVPAPVDAPRAGVTVDAPAGHEQAMRWFIAEQHVLLALLEQVARAAPGPYVWQLAEALAAFLYRRGMGHDQLTVQGLALRAAQRCAAGAAEGGAHIHLARSYLRLRRDDEAETHLRAALELFVRLGEADGQARAHHYLGALREQQGRYREAVDHGEQAVAICRAGGLRFGLGHALNAVGWHQIRLGGHHEAIAHCREAIAVTRELGDRAGQANSWDTLGYARHHLGDHDAAAAGYRRAIALYRELDDRYYESVGLVHLAETLQAAGRAADARDAYRTALALLDELGHADAGLIRRRLSIVADRRPDGLRARF
ncbi:BTAD domain-containing putative transcriptional regulator [Amorphoplanes nipponensis]|uniref:SARP family transcriptional regulator n=1 Tax=Actinoplanes nipponensis TaxID=135950 RepID=A0A919MQH6_9ACTN|nr:SARP family transcriptional regulator [Actinoplanes nipponensis]